MIPLFIRRINQKPKAKSDLVEKPKNAIEKTEQQQKMWQMKYKNEDKINH